MRAASANRDLDTWRDTAKALLAGNVPPSEVAWTDEKLLFEEPLPTGRADVRVSARFVALADEVILHREPGAHALLYRVLWRLVHEQPRLLDDAADPDIRELERRARQVRRAVHDMHAFVRFRQVGSERFAAWYEPSHHVLARATPFFVERFGSMRWSILTPEESVTWDGEDVVFGPGVPRHAAPSGDELEELWRTYYAATFNPARANPALMKKHIPARYWPALPETAIVGELLARAAPRVDVMLDRTPPIPVERDLDSLKTAAVGCRACELCVPATQTVFGEGPHDARLVLVGEQPGDHEDLEGTPFVGPSGEVLDAALARAGISRAGLYLTNAVKHFRFLPRGKKRLHQRPTAEQIRACRPWLAAELTALSPQVIVCLGSVAATSLVGSMFKITQERGKPIATRWAPQLIATHHPAAILRCDPDDRPRYEAELAADLITARELLAGA